MHMLPYIGLGLWCLMPFSTYFSYIVVEYPEKTTSHLQTWSHNVNVVSSTPHLNGIQTHNVSGDRHWLQM